MNKYWLLLILPLLLLAWWGLGRGNSEPVVHFEPVQSITIESTVSTNGKVEPARWAAARAQISGVVKAVEVTRGQNIRPAQVLVSLDTESARASLAAALAQEQQAEADAHILGQGGKPGQLAGIRSQIQTAEAAAAVAQRNYDSLQRLLQQQAATKLQVLDAQDALTRAQLQLKAAQEQQRALVTASDREVAQARLNDARSAVELARHQLALASIASPMAGTLYQFDLKVGAYLQAGDLVGLVGDLDQMKVTVYVDEPDLGRVAVGMPVQITWDALPGRKWWGRVDGMPTQVVALGSRTVGEVTSIVSNPNRDLLPGVTVNALVVSKVVNNVVSVPKSALRTLHGADGIYLLKAGNRIEWTRVSTGVSDVNNVQILSGVKTGDQVMDRVVEPSDAEISNGLVVRPVF